MNSKLLKLARMVLKLAEVETDKGVLISDGALEVGVEAFVENAEGELVAAEDGEYKADDDKVYVIVDGKVAEIREPEPEAEQAPAEAEQPVEENQEEQEPEAEEAPEADPKDEEIAKLQAQIEELNNIIAEKDEEIGKLKAELEKSDAEPAEEQLKSQKPEQKTWTYKPRY